MSDTNGKSLKYVCAYAVVRILIQNTLYKCIVQNYDAVFTDSTERVEYSIENDTTEVTVRYIKFDNNALLVLQWILLSSA